MVSLHCAGADADHGRDFHPLADHMTNYEISTRVKFVSFQRFHFHFKLMFKCPNSWSEDFTKTTHKS